MTILSRVKYKIDKMISDMLSMSFSGIDDFIGGCEMEEFIEDIKEVTVPKKDYNIYINENLTVASISKLIQEIQVINGVAVNNTKIDINCDIDNINRIVLNMSSGGGVLLPTFMLIDTIKKSRIPVDAVITHVGSAATLIALACRHRSMHKLSSFVFHDVHIDPGLSSVTQHQETIDRLVESRMYVIDYYNLHSNMSKDKAKELVHNNRDYIMNSEECLRLGLVHEVF